MVQLRRCLSSRRNHRDFVSAKIYLKLTFQIGISCRKRGALERSVDSAPLQITSSACTLTYIFHLRFSRISPYMSCGRSAGRKATISRYISYYLRSLYRITMYPLSSCGETRSRLDRRRHRRGPCEPPRGHVINRSMSVVRPLIENP